MPVLISCRDLAKAYDAHPLFDGLSLGFQTGERVGLIGPNGAGKSTLLRILAGSEVADEGERALAAGVSLAFLAQRDDFAAGATPTSVLTAAVAAAFPHEEPYEHAPRVEAALTAAGFAAPNLDRTQQDVATLSGGWRKRLAIARLLIAEADLLLLDEPTNHLDLDGIWWLEQRLAALPPSVTVILISHDRFFLERACNRVIELNRLYPGGCFASNGGYATFLEKRAEFVANQRKQADVLDNKMRRESEWLRRNPAAQTVKSKARVERAGDLAADLAALKYRNAQIRTAAIDFTASGRRTNDLVVLSEVAGARAGRTLFRGVDLTLTPGLRLGVLGLNGSGKTTLLRILARQLEPSAGTVKHAGELKIVIFDQQRERLDQSVTLRRALCPNGDTVVFRGRGIHVAAWAKRFLFAPPQLDLAVGKLSGGEQARVLIANLMLREADLLILDEPTNDLDIPTLEVLEESLIDFPGALVLVTHDRWLLDRVSTDLIALDGAGGAYRVADCGQWEGLAARLTAAREREAERAASAPPARGTPGAVRSAAVTTPGAEAPARPIGAGLPKHERRELERLPDKITAAEAAVTAIEARLADPAMAGDPVALERACADLATAQASVETLYARWSELESKSGG